MESDQPSEQSPGDFSNVDEILAMEGNEFQAAFGEPVDNALNLDTWQIGEDLATMYLTLEKEVADAVKQGGRIRERTRSELFPIVFKHPQAPLNAGCYQVDIATLERIHRGLLFNGGVEACDGTSLTHDTLPITIAQIGVSLVSYQGDQGTWVHRLFRRDLRVGGLDPIDEAIALLERRRKRDSTDVRSTRDKLSEFTQRGIMAFAERAILLHKSQALWRMGHGHPVPYELLTGGGLVIDKDMPLRVLLTLGDALYPLEYALVGTPLQMMRDVANGHLPEGKGLKAETQAFVEELGPQIVIGLYRASAQAPVRLFYAHRDCSHLAALIVIADSVLQEHRGFPMLIDLADMVCHSTFGSATFNTMIQQAYAEAGTPFRYLGERETRR